MLTAMTRLHAAFLCLLCLGGVLPAQRALLEGLKGRRWSVDGLARRHFAEAGLIDVRPRESGEKALWLSPRGNLVGWSALRVEGIMEMELDLEIWRPEGATLHLAVGCDQHLHEGFEVVLGDHVLLRPRPGTEASSRKSSRGIPASAWAKVSVIWKGHFLRVHVNDEPCANVRVRDLRAGRVYLGAKTATVRVQVKDLECRLTPQAEGRIKLLARPSRNLEPVLPVEWSLGLPVQEPFLAILLPRLATGLGADGEDQIREVQALWREDRPLDAIARTEELLARTPAAEGPRLLLGMLLLYEHGDAGRVDKLLRDLDKKGPAGVIRAEACWRTGQLEQAAHLFAVNEDPWGVALTRWTSGDEEHVRRRLEDSSDVLGKNGWLARFLLHLKGWEGWHSAPGVNGMELLSDQRGHWNERGLTRTHLWASAVETWLKGEQIPFTGSSVPPLVLVCSDPRTFDLWNHQFGGARFMEANGVYRQGHRTLFIREDSDPKVTKSLLRHEFFHHMVYERMWVLPPMLEEGLAELLAHCEVSGTRLRVDRGVAPGRLAGFLKSVEMGHGLEPREVLLNMEPRDSRSGRVAYSTAWATLRLMAQEPGRLGGLLQAVTVGDASKIEIPTLAEVEAHIRSLQKLSDDR